MSADLNIARDQKQEELNQEYAKGVSADLDKIEALKREIADLTVQIDTANDSGILSVIDNLVIHDTPLRQFFKNDDDKEAEFGYQVVTSAIKQILIGLVDKDKAAYNDVAEQLAEEKAARKDDAEKYADLYEQFSALKTELSQTKLELEDTQAKRDAAVEQLEEAQKEINRLNSQVDDLRKEIAVGATGAVKVVDASESFRQWMEAKNASEAAKPAIYDVQAADHKQSRFTAKLASTDEVIEFGYLEKGKYREVTPEQAESFRAEYLAKEEAKRAEEDLALGTGTDIVAPTVPQFQEDDKPEHGLDETNTDVALAGEAVTRKEFEELKARVAQLEGTTIQGSAA